MLFFKSLSGDIISIDINHLNDLNNIRNHIASLNGCDFSQVIILDENSENDSIPPQIIENKCYNFFIREKDTNYISFNCIKKAYDNKTKERYKVLEIYIYDQDHTEIQKIVIYNKKNLFYHKVKQSIVKNDKEYIIFENKQSQDIYDIISKNINVPWYDKNEVIDRIMYRWESIKNYKYDN